VPVTPALENFKQVFLKTGLFPEKFSPVLWGMKVIRKVVLKLHIICIYLINHIFITRFSSVIVAVAKEKKFFKN
jgi:hypothetical protein